MTIAVVPEGSQDTGPCDCCGSISRRVWGRARAEDDCIAIYFVHWTVGEVHRHGANFDLIVGDLDEGSATEEHWAVSLAYRLFESGGSFMVIDAADRPLAKSPFVGRALARSEVIGSPLAQDVFAIIDAIWLGDPRLADITSPV